MPVLNDSFQRASFFRRLAAMVYDALVATAVGMCAGLVIQVMMLILFEVQLINNQGFENYMDLFTQSDSLKLIANIWVGFWISGFFLWFWKNGGQTLGMRAWRLKIFNLKNEATIGYPRLALRMFTSFLGLGTLLVLIDYKNKLSLQDRIAQTEVLFLSKEANDHKSW
ncbi:RDD family protein [Glaciecola sp. MH2013]|nr:RDD family protein [Glaciecola sp. MH2013]